ncbi:hypothetical protein SEA_TRIBUTE_234 [Streptomyces phage Tribute]|uniref:Uncharacterized protein n=5 Tax=Samistivirus TaxID=2560220 RepID=A0A5Q2WL34_9CAUD|nr:hypothetical protein FDI38_gp073 [Streptomyces phage Peebs]YP_010101618.1 hypothetical protein KNU49_gp070 [Streptomyces phage EGole]ASR76624.1 hypothetical protein SEA_SUSHI23_239 [Streptomyces phage Sushi23]QAX95927.1 hypothetical protein SEA_TEUTSCH_237 [Streptomyces phage Teutsch]QGH78383.1 hypothetical protein SEA_TRIBUTE_234 [Streptomyces phage Tribute]WDS51991.1 hypothetical protein SEA_PEPPERWOOD_238 [Streptomyces phage Pepperwood]WNN95554.1 hypothetical protein SEA_WATERMOORE_236 
MDERESFVLTTDSAIIDSVEEAVRNLNISVSLLSAILQEALAKAKVPIDDDTVDAFGIVEQSTASINMFLERLGLWNSKD